MRELRRDNFGLLIAYILPGSVALWGAAYHVEAVALWLRAAPREAPSIGGFLYATLASTALGLVISAVRWALVDRVLARAGVRQPDWDFERFAERLPAYEWLVANHYRYYQFYANLLVALAGAYASRLCAVPSVGAREALLAVAFGLTEAVLFAGAKDTLGKYYARTEALLARGRRRRRRRLGPAKGRAPAGPGRVPGPVAADRAVEAGPEAGLQPPGPPEAGARPPLANSPTGPDDQPAGGRASGPKGS